MGLQGRCASTYRPTWKSETQAEASGPARGPCVFLLQKDEHSICDGTYSCASRESGMANERALFSPLRLNASWVWVRPPPSERVCTRTGARAEGCDNAGLLSRRDGHRVPVSRPSLLQQPPSRIIQRAVSRCGASANFSRSAWVRVGMSAGGRRDRMALGQRGELEVPRGHERGGPTKCGQRVRPGFDKGLRRLVGWSETIVPSPRVPTTVVAHGHPR